MSSSGSLAQLTAADVIRGILLQGISGRLVVRTGAFRKTAYFEKGHPVYALSTDPNDGMGELLVRSGRITRDQLRAALRQSGSTREVGRTLVALGSLPDKDLLWAVQHQAEEILLSLFALTGGQFLFEELDPAADGAIRLQLKTEWLLREGARRMRDPRLLLRALGSLDSRVEVPRDAQPLLRLRLEGKAAGLLETLRSAPLSVRELCQRSPLPAMETCQALVALVAAGEARRIA